MITCKEKTREELIAGIKRAIERKRAFEEEAQKEFADMRRRAAACRMIRFGRMMPINLS